MAVLAKPRFTADIDIVIKIELRDIQELAKDLQAINKAWAEHKIWATCQDRTRMVKREETMSLIPLRDKKI